MRLDKFLSECGFGTRSEIKKLIRTDRVSVVGAKSKPTADMRIDENTAEVFVDGEPVAYKKYIYLMLNKPNGYLSATYDKDKAVVLDLVPPQYRHFDLFPVGRLDIDTVGLIVLTNDGALSHRLLSPRHHIPKTYYAEVSGRLGDAEVSAFAEGMDLGDFIAQPSEMTIVSSDDDKSAAEVTIYEGKFHQIKRMFEKMGHTVTYLKRTAMNRLSLDESLDEGELRELTDRELELLIYET
ncbi:MAG: pseudouridine synthase [Clostridia bacterium]|nr:pseudouridine synthase [Clostridia bacterium]